MLTLLLAYPVLVAVFFLLLALVGYGGVEEVVVPRWLRWLPRWGLAPLYGFRPCDATTSGYATLFYPDEPGVADDLRTHEGDHRAQAFLLTASWRIPVRLRYILGPPMYAVAYIWEYLRHGYVNNKYEVHARQAAGQV